MLENFLDAEKSAIILLCSSLALSSCNASNAARYENLPAIECQDFGTYNDEARLIDDIQSAAVAQNIDHRRFEAPEVDAPPSVWIVVFDPEAKLFLSTRSPGFVGRAYVYRHLSHSDLDDTRLLEISHEYFGENISCEVREDVD